MTPAPTRSTPTVTRFPNTTPFRSPAFTGKASRAQVRSSRGQHALGPTRRARNIRNPAARHTRVLHMWPQPATIAGWGSGDAGIWGTRGKHNMAVTRPALKRETHPKREGVPLAPFVWQGTDKRGVTLKGAQQSRNAKPLSAEHPP